MKKVNIIAFSAICLMIFALSSCSGIKKDAEGREDFNSFIKKFYDDKDFQISRIDFPITGKMQDDGKVQIIEKENWEILKPIDPKNPDYEVINRKISEDLIEQQVIVKRSFSIEMQFSLNPASKEWYMTSYTGVAGVAVNAKVDSTMLDSTRTVRVIHPDSIKNEN